eukprot:3964190-Prymnesium_polylepis.1
MASAPPSAPPSASPHAPAARRELKFLCMPPSRRAGRLGDRVQPPPLRQSLGAARDPQRAAARRLPAHSAQHVRHRRRLRLRRDALPRRGRRDAERLLEHAAHDGERVREREAPRRRMRQRLLR